MHIKILRARRQDVSNLLRHAESLGISKAGKLRLAWFAYALAHEGNVSLTCRYFGISRSTFLRWAKRFNPRRPDTLEEHSRRPHRVRTPETDPKIVERIRDYRTKFPTMGKEQIALKLSEEHSVVVSSSTVGRVIARERLFFGNLPSHQHKRDGLDLSAGTETAHPAATKGRSTTTEKTTPASSVSDSETGEADVGPSPAHPSKSQDDSGLPSADLPAFGS